MTGLAAAAVVHDYLVVGRGGNQGGLRVESARLGLNQPGRGDKRRHWRSTWLRRNARYRRNRTTRSTINGSMVLMLQLLLQFLTLMLNLVFELFCLVFDLIPQVLLLPMGARVIGTLFVFELFGVGAGLLFCESGLVFEDVLLGFVGGFLFCTRSF